ncbi:MAG TPA: hypothetical protein VK859_12400, partial [bacterium]|nr:hypothetical protein [bacterium]
MKKRWIWMLGVTLMSGMSLSLCSCGSKNSPAPTTPAPGGFSYSLTNYLGISGTNPMNGPDGIAISGNSLWVANEYNFTFQAWSLSGTLLSTVTTYNSTSFEYPTGVAVGPDGFIYVVDSENKQFVEFTPTGLYAGAFGSSQLSVYSTGIALNATDAYVTDYNVLHHYTVSGTGSNKNFYFQSNYGTTGAGALAA